VFIRRTGWPGNPTKTNELSKPKNERPPTKRRPCQRLPIRPNLRLRLEGLLQRHMRLPYLEWIEESRSVRDSEEQFSWLWMTPRPTSPSFCVRVCVCVFKCREVNRFRVSEGNYCSMKRVAMMHLWEPALVPHVRSTTTSNNPVRGANE